MPIFVYSFEGRETGEESGSKPKWLYLEDTSDNVHCFAQFLFTNAMGIADKFLHEAPSLSRYLKVLDTFKGTRSRLFCVYSFFKNWRNSVCRNRIVNPPLRTGYWLYLFSGLRRWEGRNCKKIPLVLDISSLPVTLYAVCICITAILYYIVHTGQMSPRISSLQVLKRLPMYDKSSLSPHTFCILLVHSKVVF